MYILKHEKDVTVFYLTEDRDYSVGRKNADLVISEDASISRKHAILALSNEILTLTDCGSKYNTHCNGKKLVGNTPTRIKDKDLIKFGVFESIYTVEKISIITTGSGLNNTSKLELRNKISKLGGSVLSEWDESCTHLTAEQIMLTVKVLLALIDEKPFVTVAYWDKFIANVREGLPVPNVDDYKPKIAETLINRVTFEKKQERRELFKNKIFVFPTQKLKLKMQDLVVKTGGSVVSWDQGTLTFQQITKSPKDYIFIHNDDVKSLPQSLKNIYEHIMKLGQRTIPIQEIAMAVVLCSTEKDCNPYFNRLEKVFIEEDDNGGFSEVFPLAPESQSQHSPPIQPKHELIIPASLDADLMPPPSFNREATPTPSTSFATPKRLSDEEPVGNPFKRVKQEKSSAEKPNTKKRKGDELVEAPATKKSPLRQNPFAVFGNKNNTKRSLVDNPFASLRLKTEVKVDDDNPFKQCLKKQKEKIVSPRDNLQTIDINDELEQGDSQCSKFEDSGSSSNSEIIWLSKTEIIKHEESTLEPELKDIFDRFKDSVVIEILSVTRIVPSQDQTDGCHAKTSNGKNFKKFRKVQPLRPQTNVLNISVNNIIKSELIFPEDEPDEEERVQPVVKRNINKRFVF